MRQPPYVWMTADNGRRSALRWDADKKQYWRDAGNWGVTYAIGPKGMVSESRIASIAGWDLIICSKQEWEDDNWGYVGASDRRWKS